MNAPLSKEQIELLMSDRMSVRSHLRPGFLARMRAALDTWLQRRAVLAELHGLSDRDLADIGLQRADLPRVFDPAFANARDQAVSRAASV